VQIDEIELPQWGMGISGGADEDVPAVEVAVFDSFGVQGAHQLRQAVEQGGAGMARELREPLQTESVQVEAVGDRLRDEVFPAVAVGPASPGDRPGDRQSSAPERLQVFPFSSAGV
jgi:hypothetical protein